MNKYIIAIDGPSAAGKECLATAVSKRLGIIYIDTGAMYRSVAYYFMRNNVNLDDIRQVEETLNEIRISFKWHNDKLHTYLNDVDVTKDIREEQVGLLASKISAIKTVRYDMVDRQRKLGEKESIVLDGRDIGSVVFPNADVKIFLTGDVNTRAKRRYTQHIENGDNITYEEVLENMLQRDHNDINKSISPLIQTKDAVLVDTTDLTKDQVFDEVMKILKEKEVI